MAAVCLAEVLCSLLFLFVVSAELVLEIACWFSSFFCEFATEFVAELQLAELTGFGLLRLSLSR